MSEPAEVTSRPSPAAAYGPVPRIAASPTPAPTPALEAAERGRRRWTSGWRRSVFPSVWLVYLGETIGAIGQHSSGVLAVVGYVVVVLYAAGYVVALPVGWGGHTRRFRVVVAAMAVLSVVEIPIAHEGAFVMWVYLAVLVVAGFRRWAAPVIAGLTAVAVVLPALVPSWHRGPFWDMLVTIPLVGLAMYGFFSVVDTNRALAEARTEVARLAAENERTRIARDLHDLLGHSLTTITVKAGLARKLAERETADGAASRTATEIADVEAIARRSLSEVRAAVTGYREVGLAGEIATARAVLRAAGIDARLPAAVDVVDPTRSELFGWVVREGVTNVVRHARAARCVVEVGPTWVQISDDGFGVVAPGAMEPGAAGSGLAGLRERVATAGGTLSVGRTTDGWRLRVDVPRSPAPAAAPTVVNAPSS